MNQELQEKINKSHVELNATFLSERHLIKQFDELMKAGYKLLPHQKKAYDNAKEKIK